MPIKRYVENGAVFPPKALSVMGKAFEAAIEILGTGSDDIKRQAVAKLIIKFAQGGDLDATSLRDKAVEALSELSAP